MVLPSMINAHHFSTVQLLNVECFQHPEFTAKLATLSAWQPAVAAQPAWLLPLSQILESLQYKHDSTLQRY
jgi:hypothetical protein